MSACIHIYMATDHPFYRGNAISRVAGEILTIDKRV